MGYIERPMKTGPSPSLKSKPYPNLPSHLINLCCSQLGRTSHDSQLTVPSAAFWNTASIFLLFLKENNTYVRGCSMEAWEKQEHIYLESWTGCGKVAAVVVAGRSHLLRAGRSRWIWRFTIGSHQSPLRGQIWWKWCWRFLSWWSHQGDAAPLRVA